MDLKQLLSQTNVKEDVKGDVNDGVKDDVKEEVDDNVTNTNCKDDLSGNGQDEVIDTGSDLEDMDQEEDEEDDKEDKLDPRFTLPWNKLEKGVKMNRLLIFIQSEKDKYTLTEQQSKELKNLLFKVCENGLFNKISDVEYDESKAEIKSIKNLEFNESSKKYKIKTGGTKNRSVSKSRSNIDRLTKKK